MALNIGNNAVANAFVGSSQVRRAYKGGTLVYQGFGPASELEFIQKEATGGPAQLLKVYGKSVIWRQLLHSNKTAELRAERIPVINVWDEEWEQGGINASNGQNQASINQVRSKNYIKVIANRQYFLWCAALRTAPANSVALAFYDSEKSLIGLGHGNNRVFTIPSNCSFLRFWTTNTYGGTYKNDICLNISDPAINGTYFPHWRGSLALNLSTLTGRGRAWWCSLTGCEAWARIGTKPMAAREWWHGQWWTWVR